MPDYIMLQTISSLIEDSLKKYSKEIFIIEKNLYRRKIYTYQQIYDRALSVCSYFSDKNIKKGDRIIIYLPNSSNYAVLLWACALSGVIAVPIDFNSSPKFAQTIYNKTKSKLIFCSVFKIPSETKNVFAEQIEEIYSKQGAKGIKKIALPSDIFEIVFTSGTTSDPKGVVLTNKNLYSDIISVRKIMAFSLENKGMLSILPLSHLLEQNVGFFAPINQGIKIVYLQSKKPSSIIEAVKKEHVKLIVTVPLFLESLKEKIELEAVKKGNLQKLRRMLERFSSFPVSIKRIIYREIYSKMPSLRYFIVGGASLDIELERFWDNLGIQIIQGYGLTESSPVITSNYPNNKKQGTLGIPLDGVEVKIHDGEIIARGDNVFEGYYKDDEKTKDALKNGWLNTGDIGSIDEDGFIKFIGRKKNVIVSPSGLKVYPEDIEKIINKNSLVKESAVLGLEEGRKIVACIIPARKISEKEKDDMLKSANSKLQVHQLISEIYIWHESEFPKTATMKIKKGLIEEGVIARKSMKGVLRTSSEDRLISIIAEICKLPANKIKNDSNLVSLGVDSVKRIELSVKIEEAFGCEFNEDEINEKTKVKNLRNIIKTEKTQKSESGISPLNSKPWNIIRAPLQGLAMLLGKSIFSLEIKGRENLNIIQNEKTPVIFAANHTSMLDTFAVYRALPFSIRLNTFAAAAKDFFFKNYITAFFARLTFNAFAFSRKENIKQSLTDFGEIINRNSNVLIYPEGTRSREGKLGEFKAGTGLMALNTDVPIIPIKIEGLHEIMPVGKLFPRLGKKAKLIIGKPIKISRMMSPIEITDKVYKAIKELK